MVCARNMMALIPPVAPSSSAAERFRPSHHTLERGTLAVIFSARLPARFRRYFFLLSVSVPRLQIFFLHVLLFHAKRYSAMLLSFALPACVRGFSVGSGLDIMKSF